MVERNRLFPLSFFEKSPFTGSDKLLRYRIEKQERKNSRQFLVTAWFGEYSFENTPDEDKTTHNAPFSEEGLDTITDWLNGLRRPD